MAGTGGARHAMVDLLRGLFLAITFKNFRLGRALPRCTFVVLTWLAGQAGPALALETLDMLVATQNGATSTTGTTFTDALCLSNPTAGRDLLVVASFASQTTGSSTSRVIGDFRLSHNGVNSVAHARFLNGGSDLGVGNVVWVFRAASVVAGNVCLQHRDDGTRRIRTEQITITAPATGSCSTVT
jgi:hypothetical protein